MHLYLVFIAAVLQGLAIATPTSTVTDYIGKVDEAINALLENNLPPHLLEMDQSLPKQEVKEEDKTPAPVPRSVYDEDEFDVLNRDVIDTSRIHKGKKNKSSGIGLRFNNSCPLCASFRKVSYSLERARN